jgi:hypothetical protein
VHDNNAGINPNGLFWTVQLPVGSFQIDRYGARLHAERVPVLDSFQFGGVFSVPAVVDFDIDWRRREPFQHHGEGTDVPKTDPAAFLGRFAAARSRGTFSGIGPGFAFTGQGDTADGGYGEIGHERNGSFL